ncbi:MAG: aspartate aminotransferase family protein [Paracoccaceae bacterium]|mgnify:FL=1
MEDCVLATYNRKNVSFKKGDGIWLYSEDGGKFLDCASGIAVNILGHCNEKLVNTLIEQAKNLWHTSNLYRVENQEKLAKLLVDNTFADRVFFTNSGTEAIECAIKMARIYFSKLNQKRYEILSFDGCFHGRSMAAISTSNSNKMKEGFGPLIPGFKSIAFNDKSALFENITDKTAAVIVEPIQGEGGIRLFSEEMLKLIRDLCDKCGALLIIDEIQCGVGRSGKLFAHEWFNIKPDIMTIAKGIGGGFPLGACLSSENASIGMGQGKHGSTYGGNPLACAVGCEVMNSVLEKGFLENVRKISGYLSQKILGLVSEFPSVFEEIRGSGLMLGVKTKIENTTFTNEAFNQNLLLAPASDNVVRILPPLNISKKEVDLVINLLRKTSKGLKIE